MAERALRGWAQRIVGGRWFQAAIIGLILLNAVALGLETYVDGPLAGAAGFLAAAEVVFVAVFAAELVLKGFAYGRAFFRDPWNWFDMIVVGIALVPASSGFSVLRMLRILRILRLVSVVPQMRTIVTALFRSVPGLGTVSGLLLIIVYTAAVLGERLFHEIDPEHFGDLGTTLYTMFVLLTTEDWPEVAQPVLEREPVAWVFFIGYIVLTAFIMLNVVIGVIVTAMEQEVNAERWEADQELELEQHQSVMNRLEELTEQVARLSDQVRVLGGGLDGGGRPIGGDGRTVAHSPAEDAGVGAAEGAEPALEPDRGSAR
ncbi:ion transporter [Streptomonospora wellingtoniae]|uniref:Ion transporter n=1 Tax=Streptomonospora wellingtoniae TaxID=3075544 RepID=A0ABU2KV57_9ACTN|nr:ion transporter [Streptomonospora sp. DSM 45055]MDT0303150.1 ion transporter [Streptomonospora sp. DSM 45055]